MMTRSRANRIMFFHAYPHQYAGAQRVTHTVVAALPRWNFVGRVVTVDEGPFPAQLRETDIDVQIIRAPVLWRRYGGALLDKRMAVLALITLPLYWFKLARAIRAWSPLLLHINDHRAMLLAGPAAKLAGVPVVWHIHGPFQSGWINRFGGVIATRILVVSNDTLAATPILRERFGGKVTILHNGLPPASQFNQDQANECCIIDGRPTIVCGARIHPDKGLDILLQATATLRQDFPDIQVLIIGNVQQGYEKYYEELKSLCVNLGLEHTCRFVGSVRNPLPYWKSATVYAQPSRAEPFGLAILEAMAVGTPVVASRVGGLMEIIESGRSGILVQPENSSSLAEGIGRLLRDSPLAARIGEEGRRRATIDFSQDRMLSRLVDIYRDISFFQ